MEKQIQAALFDLGDTLINFGPLRTFEIFERASEASYAYLEELKQPVGSFGWYHFWNANGIRFRLLISFLTGNDFDSLEALQYYGHKKGFNMTDEQWQELNWLWYSPLVRTSEIEEDLADSLRKLKDNGIKLGIVSNTFVNGSSLDRHLDMAGVLDLFDMRLYSYEMNCRKPDPRIFIEGARRIGVDPENILFIGDRIEKDVVGCRKVGMIPILKSAYTNAGKTVPRGVTKIERISELPQIVENINGIKPDEVMIKTG